MTRKSAQPWQNLQALVVAIEAAATRDPYPRLAQYMQTLAPQRAAARAAGASPLYG